MMLQSSSLHVPRELRTNSDLRALQRVMTQALVQPLTPDDGLRPRWHDGRAMEDLAAEFIKPNDRLTSFERLEIYARCYWFRLIDCVYSDCPMLLALLGDETFTALARAYLAKYPSRSHSLRNLCDRLPQFILDEPRWTAPRTKLAHQIARFEWAQTVAFDGEAGPRLSPDDIADAPPARLRLALQPYLSLLTMNWALDDFAVALKKRETLRAEASNAIDRGPARARVKRVPPPKRERVHLVVHRVDERLYYKRVSAAAFRMLEAIAAGRTLAQGVEAAGTRVKTQDVREWFSTWMRLGWFCRR